MKTLKHFALMCILLCCGHWASAQCQAYFLDSLSGGNIYVNAYSNGTTNATFGWTLDGHTAIQPNPNTSGLIQNVANGTHTVCLQMYSGGQLCDTFCRTVTIQGSTVCPVASFTTTTSSTQISAHSTSTGTDTNTVYIWHVYSGSTLLQNVTGGENFTSNAFNIGNYTVCLLIYSRAIGTSHPCDSICHSVTLSNSTPCPTASFTDSTTATQVFAHSTSTGTDSTTIYVWKLKSTNGTVLQATTNGGASFTSNSYNSGSYILCLLLYRSGNGTTTLCDSTCQNITLSAPCNGLSAYFFSPTYNSNNSVSFTPYDTVHGITHYWSFGDGTTSTDVNPTHGYSAGGLYHVCQYVSISGTACRDSFCRDVQANAVSHTCSAHFTWHAGNTQGSISFTSNSTASDSILYYAWNFNDSTNHGSGQVTDHIFTTPGTHVVCLTIGTAGGCGSTFCDSVVVTSNPCANVIAAYTWTQSAHNDTVEFNSAANLLANATSYWNFGDGHTGSGAHVVHGFAQPGTYHVCHYVYYTPGGCIDSSCVTVTVVNRNACGVAALQAYSINGTIHAFSGSTGVDSTTYYEWWVWGSNGAQVQTQYGHDNLFISQVVPNGTYLVCLYIYNGNQNFCDSACTSVTVNNCSVSAAFTTTTLQNAGVHFIPTNTSNAVQSYWSFGDGSTSTLVDPTHYYTHSGTYTVCHYVYVSGTNCMDSVCHSVTVTASTGCNASFATSASVNSLSATFGSNSTSSDSIVVYAWTFGDGSTGNGHYITHQYNHAGTYYVCLRIETVSGCSSTHCDSVHVGTVVTGCHASFTWLTASNTNNTIYFNNTSTSADSIAIYYWNFGDNTTANTMNTSHTYAHSGTYYVCLYISNGHGCTSTHCDSIRVVSNPCLGLSAAWTYTYTSGGGVHFAGANNISGVTNIWSFGDGTYATTNDPVHYYTQSGAYTVCHIVSIPGSTCSDTSCSTVQGTGTGTGCHASYTYTTVGGTTTVEFTNNSTISGSTASYYWSFGDGSTSTDVTPHHPYAHSGTYYVCLTVSTPNNCTNTYCDSIHVGANSTACHASFTYSFDSCQVVSFVSNSTGPLSFLRWIYGDGTTDTTYQPHHHYAQPGTYTVILHFYGTNQCYNFDTVTIVVPACNTNVTDTVCGVVFNDLNGNGVQDNGEPGIGGAEVHIGNYIAHADSNGHYSVSVPSGTYYIYYCAPTGYTFTIPVNSNANNNTNTCGVYSNIHITGSHCGFNFGIQVNSVTICGLVYYDANNNGVFDPNSEAGIPNAEVHLSGGNGTVYTVTTDQYGHYCAVVPVGTYTVTAVSSTYHNGTVTPASITVAATTAGHTYGDNNFGFYTQATGCDLSINITPHTNVSPGYPAWYDLEVCNNGGTAASGDVNFFYDPALGYNYTSPAPASQNSSTYTITWNLVNLAPGACQHYWISLRADSILPLGQFIFNLASVNTTSCNDANLNNNVDTTHQEVTGSWDPNNKLVSPVGEGPHGLIAPNQELTYTINFQNTGNAEAVNIVVHDMISNDLDLSTFRMISSSHPYTMQFLGREAIWKFNAIMLPYSSIDEQGSHGYVSFAITPLAGLAPKTQVTNTAEIFFDYNEGVTTNSTMNMIDYVLSVDELANSNVTIALMPNPFTDHTTIKIEGADAAYELQVYDMTGRVVKHMTAENNTFSIERGTMASGLYLYQILEKGKVIGKGKMVAE